MRVLVASDRPLIGDVVTELFRDGCGLDVRQSPDAQSCRELVEAWRPHVVFLDLGVPEREVRRLCAELNDASVRSIVVSAEADEALRMLEAGATGISWAADGLEGARQTLDTVRGGHTHVPPALLGGVLRGLIGRQREHAAVTHAVDRLSAREREVLALLGEGCDQRDIARRLDISPQTAKTHIRHVLHKLGVRSRLEAATLAAELETANGSGS
jgi:DNA-binding NarL/FixJ family response regulator